MGRAVRPIVPGFGIRDLDITGEVDPMRVDRFRVRIGAFRMVDDGPGFSRASRPTRERTEWLHAVSIDGFQRRATRWSCRP